MPKVNHEILSWARETAGFDPERAAAKLQISSGKLASATEKLLHYETGAKEPSRAMLLRMAKLYRRPLLTFYLDRPPAIGDRGQDFRTLSDNYSAEDDYLIDALIREIKASQNVIRETLIDQDEAVHLEYVGKNSMDQGVSALVDTMRATLDLSLQEYCSQTSYEDAFKVLRASAEQARMFVLLRGNLGSFHTNIDVTTFRGFALSDDVAPFIVINDQDSKAAWSFSLLHELAHIILGQTGISGALAEKQVEQFCNEAASEFLIPEGEFETFHLSSSTEQGVREEIARYAFARKVSGSHVSYRLFRRGDINKAIWQSLSGYFKEQWIAAREKEKQRSRHQEGGPNFYVLRRHKLGSLVGLVERFTYSGALTTTKAAMLLGVRPIKVHKLFTAGRAA